MRVQKPETKTIEYKVTETNRSSKMYPLQIKCPALFVLLWKPIAKLDHSP